MKAKPTTKKAKRSYVICTKCGWVHFERTVQEVIDDVVQFNTYFKALPKKQQQDYYGGKCSSFKGYVSCNGCGASHMEFRMAKASEIPNGSTIGPILTRNL